MFSLEKTCRQIGHWLSICPQGRQTAEWPQTVITESIGFSIHMTHSFLSFGFDSALFGCFWLDRATPQDRQTIREPKFTSGQLGHFQSPGNCWKPDSASFLPAELCFNALHRRHCVLDAKFVKAQLLHFQSRVFMGGSRVFEPDVPCAVEHLKHAVRDSKLIDKHLEHCQSPVSIGDSRVFKPDVSRAVEHLKHAERYLKLIVKHLRHFQSPGSSRLVSIWNENFVQIN